MKVALILSFLLLASCASKKEVSKPNPEDFFVLKESNLECIPAQSKEMDIKPFTVMREHSGCVLLLKPYEGDDIFFLDCRGDSHLGFMMVYTKNQPACEKMKMLFLKHMPTDEI